MEQFNVSNKLDYKTTWVNLFLGNKFNFLANYEWILILILSSTGVVIVFNKKIILEVEKDTFKCKKA